MIVKVVMDHLVGIHSLCPSCKVLSERIIQSVPRNSYLLRNEKWCFYYIKCGKLPWAGHIVRVYVENYIQFVTSDNSFVFRIC